MISSLFCSPSLLHFLCLLYLIHIFTSSFLLFVLMSTSSVFTYTDARFFFHLCYFIHRFTSPASPDLALFWFAIRLGHWHSSSAQVVTSTYLLRLIASSLLRACPHLGCLLPSDAHALQAFNLAR